MLSSNISKYIKAFFFCLLLVFCSKIMTFLLYPLSSMNKKFIDYHNFEKNIDFLVLGNSLEGNGLKSDILSEEFNQTAYCMTPQGSYPESLYYLLVDITNKHKVRNLLIGWDIIQNYQLPEYHYPHEEELYREFFADMKGNPELQKIVFKGVMNQRYTSTFFDWSSFPENITEIPEVIKSRKPGYIPKGISERIDPENIYKSNFKFNQVSKTKYSNKMTSHDALYLLKIKDFCKNQGIRFFVISCPIPSLIMESNPELKQSIEDSYNFMKENNIEYIHGNDQSVFPGSMETTNFKDFYGHIISPYSEIYSKAVCNWIKNTNKADF